MRQATLLDAPMVSLTMLPITSEASEVADLADVVLVWADACKLASVGGH